ncbi:hypothetical protein BGW37DRAFT_463757 [Umbelopsis sp. PMI_123]|nr:hypothetical protein BGW37DRAFT_463757 [Umbelopsis sp. PMI_123]
MTIKSNEIILMPLERDAFDWCSYHFQNDPYLKDLRQLYFHLIKDKDSFDVASDSLILLDFTWTQWREQLKQKDSQTSMRLDHYRECTKLIQEFKTFFGNLKRDISTKRIYDPA